MDAHQILLGQLHELIGLRLSRNAYFYDDVTVKGTKMIGLEIPKEDFDLFTYPKRIVTKELIFSKQPKVKERADTVDVYYVYIPNPNEDFSAKIDEGRKKYGVISPEGKFYECGYAGHNNLEYWLKERSIIGDCPHYGEDSFDYFGWVKLTGSGMTTVEFVFDEKLTSYDFQTKEDTILAENKLTKEQVETMISYIKSLGRELINFNYHWYNIEDFKLIVTEEVEDYYEFSFKYGLREIENENEELYKQPNEKE